METISYVVITLAIAYFSFQMGRLMGEVKEKVSKLPREDEMIEKIMNRKIPAILPPMPPEMMKKIQKELNDAKGKSPTYVG